MTSGRRRIEELIAQLEQQRSRLEDVRERAREQGGPEGERLQKQVEARLQDIDRRIEALRDYLG
jgi:chromosome segregation ATPase